MRDTAALDAGSRLPAAGLRLYTLDPLQGGGVRGHGSYQEAQRRCELGGARRGPAAVFVNACDAVLDSRAASYQRMT